MGKPVRIKAWGLLAHVFQHEIDHLNGTLFIDKAKKLYENATHEDAKHKK
jgi:peptide deformylase